MSQSKNPYLLTLIRCPYCKGGLIQITKYAARCSCSTFPIIRNIIYLKKNSLQKHTKALTYLSRGNTFFAILALLDSRKLANIIIALFPKISLRYLFNVLLFAYPSSKDWWRYLLHRNSRSTHLLTLSTIPAITSPQERILDVCCGLGNFIQLIHTFSHSTRVVGIDASFFLLYCGSLQTDTSRVLFVCSDINDGLPISNDSIDHSFCNDAAMYIRLPTLLSELDRVLTSSGDAFLTHVHNAGHKNLGQGRGISPESLKIMAKKYFVTRWLSDNELWYQLTQKHTIDFNPNPPNKSSKSYSYYLQKTNDNQQLHISAHIKQHILNTAVDFTEDSQLESYQN